MQEVTQASSLTMFNLKAPDGGCSACGGGAVGVMIAEGEAGRAHGLDHDHDPVVEPVGALQHARFGEDGGRNDQAAGDLLHEAGSGPWTGDDALEVTIDGGRPAGEKMWVEIDNVSFF